MDEETGKLEVVKEIIPTSDRDLFRFNDGGVDAKGRFWLAEIDKKAFAYGANKLPAEYGEPKGRLWRYDPDGSLHEMEKGVICGNGLAWSPDNKTSQCSQVRLMALRLILNSVLQRQRGHESVRVRLRTRIRRNLEQTAVHRSTKLVRRAGRYGGRVSTSDIAVSSC